MPIKPELRHFYGRVWRTVTRPRILARAGNKCEQCGVPGAKGPKILRGPAGTWRSTFGGWWHICTGGIVQGIDGPTRHVTVVLTIAHLNHKPGDDRDENLKALCQWCHLDYDKMHHKESRAVRKDRARPIIRKAHEPYQTTIDDALRSLDAMKASFKKVFGRDV